MAAAAADAGKPLTDEPEAIRLAKDWYNNRGPVAGDMIMGAVTAAYLNYVDELDAEWSFRYRIVPTAGCEIEAALVAPMVGEDYFVRFIYEFESGSWEAYGLDEGKASEELDSGIDLDQRLWAKLVLRCAKALKRSAANLPVYIADSSIELQLSALGAPAMQKILALSNKERELDEPEKIYVIETLQKAMRRP